MIDPKELRIGNYLNPFTGYPVKLPIRSIILKVLELNTFSCRLVEFDKISAQVETWSLFIYSDLHPIPLTEEWLIRLGFEYKKTDKCDTYKKSLIRFNYVFDGRFKGKWYIVIANSLNLDLNYCKYVHQLQNIYWCLCGEELTTETSKP